MKGFSVGGDQGDVRKRTYGCPVAFGLAGRGHSHVFQLGGSSWYHP